MKHILVTGGAGFIGANFVHYWSKYHPQDRLIILDALTYAGHLQNLPPLTHYRFIQGDICNNALVNSIFLEENVDTVIHFAAESHVERSVLDPQIFIKTNVLGTQILLDAAKKNWLSNNKKSSYRFHHISTDEVFGSLQETDPPFTEKNRYAPTSPYAASKAAADHLVRSYFLTYGLPITISHCSNNYGPYQHCEKLIPRLLSQAFAEKPLTIHGDGQHIRDWLYVEDHCMAIDLILQKGKIGESYNLGGDCQKKNLDIAKIICGILDKIKPRSSGKSYSELITFVEDRLGQDRRYAVSAEKIKNELNWQSQMHFSYGIIKTINWYIEREGLKITSVIEDCSHFFHTLLSSINQIFPHPIDELNTVISTQ